MKIFIPLLSIVLLSSCRVQKNISSSQVNTDSIVNHVKDSMHEVHRKEIEAYQKHIEELTSSGVTFETDNCPEKQVLKTLRDSLSSWSKEKVGLLLDKAALENRVNSLSNKVTITERGAITAEGNIKEAKFTNSKLLDELSHNEKTIDSLNHVITTDSVKYSKQVVTKEKVVKKTVFPWYWWLALFVVAGFIWWVRGKIHYRFNNVA